MSAPVSEPSTTKSKSIILFWDRQLTSNISIQLANIAWFKLSGQNLAKLLSPIGKRIFLRAIPGHTPDSPSMITSSSIKKTKSSREMRDMKVQLATIVANLSKVTDLVTSPAKYGVLAVLEPEDYEILLKRRSVLYLSMLRCEWSSLKKVLLKLFGFTRKRG